MVNLGLIEYNITEVIKSKLGDSTYYLIFSSHTKPSSKADRAIKKKVVIRSLWYVYVGAGSELNMKSGYEERNW